MNFSHCTKEQGVEQAARSGRWDDDLRAHAAACSVCADIALVVRFMQLDGELARREAGLPDPGRIWWKAHLREKQMAAERAVRPIAVCQRVACLCGTLTATSILVWEWPRLSSRLDGLKLLLHQAASPGSRPQTDLFAFIGGSLLMFLFSILITMYASWAEE